MTVEEQLAARLERQVRERDDSSTGSSPTNPMHDNEIKIRECMKCGERFVSESFGNRLCPKHRNG